MHDGPEPGTDMDQTIAEQEREYLEDAGSRPDPPDDDDDDDDDDPIKQKVK